MEPPRLWVRRAIRSSRVEELVDILQFGFGVSDLGVDTLEAGFELGAVAV